MNHRRPDSRETTVRLLGQGVGWRASQITCRSGPEDRPFEEAHGWVSIATVLEGSFAYRSTHGRALMTPGSILLGNRGASFCCSHEHGCGDTCVAFHFDPILMEEIAGEVGGVTRVDFPAHRIPPLESLAPLFAASRSILDKSPDAGIEEIVLRVAGHVLTLAHEGDEPRVSLSDERRMTRALALMNTRYAADLSLADMADAAGLSRFHFLRVFRRTVGVTPYRYLLGRRLDAAMQRLRRTKEPVLDIALDCGFGDLSEFTRRFRKHYGSPPARYRHMPA